MTDDESSPLQELEKVPTLLPTPKLSPDEFEDFVERLLHAHRYAADVSPRVVRVERWGRKGDKQDGIDFEGDWSASKSAAWQCKRLDKLTPADVHEFVDDCTFAADRYYLTYSGEASSDARKAMATHPGWELLDQRGLGRMLDELPLHRRRQVLDATWGVGVRKLLLRTPGEDSFLTVDDLIATRSQESNYLNDLGPFVGRADQVSELSAFLDPEGDWAPAIIVSGDGGTGKTRLMSHVLHEFELTHPELPVLWLTPGRSVDADALGELPHTPAVIVIDDAHRDPAQLDALITYQKTAPETRIVLGSRRAGHDPLRALLIRGGLSPLQIGEVELPELTLKQARVLVEALAADLDLSFEVVDHLAAQATDAPFVAVLAVNMIRRGELKGPLAMDNNLREVVMSRYSDLLVGSVDGFASGVVRRLLATFAALGAVDPDDDVLREHLAKFLGLELVDYLRLIAALDEAGVLATRGAKTRVVPDIFADQVLEHEAVEGKVDTTFVRQLWAQLGSAADTTLIANLAALGWRLSRSGRPDPVASVWDDIKQHIAQATFDDLDELVGGLPTLAYTRPVELTGLLDAVIARLEKLEDDVAAEPASTADDQGGSDAAESLPDGDEEQSEEAPANLRRLFGLPPTSRGDVERKLPRLYGRATIQEPALLEHALDKIWGIRIRDNRPPHSHPEHAQRVIEDELANLGAIPHEDFPDRVAEWTRSLLGGLTDSWGTGSPLLALSPLVEKEGFRTRMSDRRTMSMEPYFVSAKWASPLRDKIRDMCVKAIGRQNPRLAGDAVRLLRKALREPHGYFAQTPTPETVASWEDDDLATIEALAVSSRVTGSAALRREIRRSLTWSAEYPASKAIRHAARSLIHELDQDPRDDLVDWLGHDFDTRMPSMRGFAHPSIDDLPTSDAGERSIDDIKRLMAESETAKTKQLDKVLESLNKLQPANRLTVIVSAADDLRAVVPERQAHVDQLLRQISARHPEHCADLVVALSTMQASVLDNELLYLLQGWRSVDEPGLLEWLSTLEGQRREIRFAVARAFTNLDWATSPAFEPALKAGWADADSDVAQAFLAASHARLVGDIAGGIAELRANGATDTSLTMAINGAAGWNRHEWGASLDDPSASSVLEVLGANGWDDRDHSSITSGIASRYPIKVLDGLLADARAGRKMPYGQRSLATAIGKTTELAEWLINNAVEDDRHLFAVTSIALEGGLTRNNALALAIAIDTMSATQLSTLIQVLQYAPLWPVAHPELAKQALARADVLKDPALNDVTELITGSMVLIGYVWTNGRSPELERAYEHVRHQRWHETDPRFRLMLSRAADQLRNSIAQLLLDEDDD